MRTLRSKRNVIILIFTLVFILLSLLLGRWVEGQFFKTPRSDNLTSSASSQTAGTSVASPTTSGISRSVASPTTYRPGGYLVIPTIGVNASIEPVGVSSDGNLAVPTQRPWDGVGWYQYGPYPGAQGSAVIDGHLDRPGGSPAVFWKLRDLHIGDIVMVVNAGKKPLHFRVLNMKYYAPDNGPLKTIFENMTGTFLNLITCAGQWIPSQRQTTLRLVVYTALV
jgi:sortase (surface protein transpeptidase)